MDVAIQAERHIEHGSRVGQTRLEMSRGAMKHLFGVTDDRQQRIGGFDHEAVIPGAFQTQFQVVRLSLFAAKAQIRQDDPIFVDQINQRPEILVRPVHRQPMPAHHLTEAIEHKTQLDANRPTAFIPVFGAQLPLKTPCPNRKEQLNRERVNDIQQTRPTAGRPGTAGPAIGAATSFDGADLQTRRHNRV